MAGSAVFGVDGTGAYTVMGYMAGIAEEISTPVYVNSVLKYSWKELSAYFDEWLDAAAREAPDSYMHVYEWPTSWGSGDKPNYRETVGQPGSRLWAHTLNGPAANAVASFVFLDSQVPSPVNPLLEREGVKTGVHVFVHKATVMEYGLPVVIEPKLAKYLAYVASISKGGGEDEGTHYLGSSGNTMFSEGPVKISQAGGGKTKNMFTTAFKYWYASIAPDHMARDILPRVERDIRESAERFGTGGVGVRSQKKVVNMAGWASSTQEAYGKAKIEARRALKAVEGNYIAQAAERRERIYGE